MAHLELGIPLVIDLLPGRGALGGLLSVMLIARGDYVLLSACDTPFLQTKLLEAMLQTCKRGQDAVICRSSRGLEPLPGVYSCRLLQRLQAQVIQGEDLRLRTLLNACRTRIVQPEEFGIKDAEDQTFFNINTAETQPKRQPWLSRNCPPICKIDLSISAWRIIPRFKDVAVLKNNFAFCSRRLQPAQGNKIPSRKFF